MTIVTVVIREPGELKPDYSLNFELPEIPQIGSYLSICRPDNPEPFGEDVIVRHIWWRLSTSVTKSFLREGEKRVGQLIEIFVECDPAIGPYASDAWRRSMEHAKNKGVNVEDFQVARLSVPENIIKKE